MRSGSRYRICILLIVAAMSGCAGEARRVVPVGENAYRVSVSSPRFASQAGTNYKAFYAASAFCDKLGESVLFRQSQESGLHAWSPKQEELTFLCTSASLRGDAAMAKD